MFFGQVADDGHPVVDLLLHEHVVPDLDVAVLIGLGAALAPVRRAAIDVDLRARARRSRGVGPPVVVGRAPSHDPVPGDPDVLPDLHRLVVGLEDRDPQAAGVDPEDLRDELEPPAAGLALEVVAEREVAEHLEERQVSIRVPDVLDVVGAEALLHRCRARERRRRVAQEVRYELVHPRVREQEPGLGRRDQRRRGDALVPALLEEAQERLSDLRAVHGTA
jgi:hypothetical protein